MAPVITVVILIVIGYLVQAQGSIFFSQKRMGLNNKTFILYKFRSLHPNYTRPLKDRKFCWGNFLRNTNLDELPQILNILKGEMSWVGPRPLPVEYVSYITAEQNIRHTVRPGITGLAQVNGKNNLPWTDKFRLDIEYVNNISFLLDMKILVRTLVLLISFKKDISLEEAKLSK
ncbi:MAG: sugar transferase [Cyclobacteriaceae bacterium]|nr:sugar transferase [Cyclobacteriaceae bacterium]